MSKSELLPIEEKVQHQVEACFPDIDFPSFVVGVSGGPDSMALLHILQKLGAGLHVVHINYQKRGVHSEKDAKLVKQTARDFGIECDVKVASVEKSDGENFQQWARKVRYELFEKKAGEIGASGIVTAHHRDDQIETILQKIFRGSGLASWSGMDVWDGHLFRPLLEVDKRDIIEYCREQSIDYRIDSSNLQADYARNFLRNKWLPNLEQHFPGWQKNVLRVKEQAHIFEKALSYILKDVVDEHNRIKRDAFLQLEKKLQKSVLIYYLHRQHSDLEISRRTLKELDKLGDLQTGKSLQLNEELLLMRERDYFEMTEPAQQKQICRTVQEDDILQLGVSFGGFQLRAKLYRNPHFGERLYLNWDAIKWPLKLRVWQKGDRFQPLGMKGHQSVADHLTNRKVRASAKSDALVLEGADEIIYAVLFPVKENIAPPGTIAEEVKCDTSTNLCLTINSSI